MKYFSARPPRARTRLHVNLARVVGLVLSVSVAPGMASEEHSAMPATIEPSLAAVPPDCGASCRGGDCGADPCAAHGGRCADRRCSHERRGRGACRHGGCERPGCPAHCPARPATFGYYDTRWRTWPGHGIEQATSTQPVAPVMPPKSEVPTAAEESPVPGFESTQGDASDATPADRVQPDTEPSTLPPPGTDQRPAAESPAEPKPAEPKPAEPKPAEPKPGAANLFDEATLRRRSQERLAVLGQVAAQQERLRREALRQQALRFIQATPGRGAVTPATHLAPDAKN